MTWVDYFIIVVLGVSTIISMIRGFAKEAISLLMWVLAIVIASRFAASLSQMFAGHIHSGQVRFALSFAILAIVTLILGALVNYLLGELISKTGMGGTNRTIGLVFGLARGLVLISALILLAELTPLPQNHAWLQSFLLPHLIPLAGWLKGLIPLQYAHYFQTIVR
jgi:membrane protein required for colicin V production